jgi:hypothetical protein
MSLLTPLYLLGLAAISLPVVLHLIRRTPRGELRFSSTMFLRPSLPRVTRRSRLENLLLLLLRGLAVALLACAFARPFFRQAASQRILEDPQAHRVVILVDTSASMRRGNLWQQAVTAVGEAVARCEPRDEVAVFAFDEALRPIVSHQDLAQLAPGQRRALVATRLRAEPPSWSATHLGRALAEALSHLAALASHTDAEDSLPGRVVLVSDLQQGARLGALAEAVWPQEVHLELVALQPAAPTNATLARLADSSLTDQEHTQADRPLRIRVTNAADSTQEQFSLTWHDTPHASPAGAASASAPSAPGPSLPESSLPETSVPVTVPPGESRVARLEVPPESLAAPRLLLTGDAHEYDNTLFYVRKARSEWSVLHVGPGDARQHDQGLRYFLGLALEATSPDSLRIVDRPTGQAGQGPLWEEPRPPRLIVVTGPPQVAQAAELRKLTADGATLLYVITSPADGAPLATILDCRAITIREAEVANYTMLGEIDFGHPLFASMAGPQFNDFTQIRFWGYRQIDLTELPQARVVARFEQGAPAVLEQAVGKGRGVVLATGWHPADGQWSRSWKFPRMLAAVIDDDPAGRLAAQSYQVNDTILLPFERQLTDEVAVTKPDGTVVRLAAGDATFAGANQPGLYRLATPDGPFEWVVQLDPQESDTPPLPQEAFEQLGCRLTDAYDASAERVYRKQLRDIELEKRQQVWKWLIAAALGLLLGETLLAGWLTWKMSAQGATA